MNSTLTLELDSEVIEAAEKYSHEKGLSLAQVVEEYLTKLSTAPIKPNEKQRSSILELRGIGGTVPKDFDYKEERYKYLMEKHK
jgi:hypothetical protein